MTNYWLHRISHEAHVSYPLLEEGYLSIGFAEDFSNEEFLETLKSKEEESAWKYLENYNQKWSKKRSRYTLWRFIYKFNIGDKVLVPMGKKFSVYKIVGEPMISSKLNKIKTLRNHVIEGKKSSLYFNGEKIDLGFLIPVEKVKEDISRKGYADAALTSRMKMRQTNGDITLLRKSVDKAVLRAEKNDPISLYSEVTNQINDILMCEIMGQLNPDNFEKLIRWYFLKIGADTVEIPSKNQSGKSEGSDADIVATFELLKVIVLVQTKYHTGKTSDWGINQIDKYLNDMEELGDSSYNYLSWVLTSGDGFSKKAEMLAESKGIRLITGKDLGEMLLDAGLEGLDEAFNDNN